MKLPIIPVSFFSMVLGLAGLGNSWRVAFRVWGLPAGIGESIMALAAAVWVMLLVLYIGKWLFHRTHAQDELRHPVDCSYVGLIGVGAMLVANGALPYSRPAALGLFGVGALFTLGYALWQTGALWQGERDHGATTAVLYLPTVAGCFVTGTVAAGLGFVEWGQLAFGAGLFSWLAIESILLHRLYTVEGMPAAQRPTLGIQFAPPVVGAVAYLAVTDGPPDLFVRMLVGYGLLQALVILRLLPWIRQQPFRPSYWAFTFGAASLATTGLRLVERGETGAIAQLAPVLFVAANLVIGLVFCATLALAFRQQLLPKVAMQP